MFITYLAVTMVTILANATVAVGDLLRSESVLENAAQVRVALRWVPMLGALKAAGALGLLLGLLGVPWIGELAAACLVLFFLGAIAFHVRARVFHNIAAPAAFLTLAAASFVLGIAR
jgi:DoxX-like family